MRRLITFFITNPIWGNAFILITVVFGILALSNMRKSFFPEIAPRIITISVAYPGASPFEMEEGVTTKIEQALEGLSGIKKITSSSEENIANIRIEAYEDTDMDEMLTDVENTVNSINSFPVGAEKPIIKKLKVGEMGGTAAFLSLSGPDDLWQLKAKSEEIKNDFLASAAISQLRVVGYPEVEISIEIKEERLLEYGLRFDQIVSAVRGNNLDLTGGTIKTKEEDYIIRLRARETVSGEIEKIVIRANNEGELIRLSDVADVKFQFADRPYRSYLDGKRNVSIIVSKLPEEDLGAIAEFLEQYTKEFNRKNNAFELKIIFQFSDMLQERIDLLTVNGMQGFALVLLCLGFFLSLRVSFWVAFGIPVSFLGLFIIGYLYGMTINMISLFGMIIVIGILVDDGIVISENIYAHYERGKSPLRAALDGTLEVFSSVVASVLTTVVAFSLLMFVGGQFEMMREMAFAVVATLLFSLVEAILTLPQHLGHDRMLKPMKIGWYNRIRQKINALIDKLRDGYAWLLSRIMSRARIAIFVPMAFIAITAFLFNQRIIKFTFFPNVQLDDITLSVAFKPGERDTQTENFLWMCQEKINEVRNELLQEFGDTIITATTLSIGSAEALDEIGGHAGNIRIQIDIEGKDIESFTIAERIRKKIGPVTGPEKFTIGGEGRFGKPVSLMMSSNNQKELIEARDFVKNEFENLGPLKDVTDNSPLGTQEIHIDLKPKAYLLGLTRTEITRQIRQGFFGDEAQRLIIGEDEVRVWIRYPEEDRRFIGQLESMRIKTINGETIPVNELVDFKIQRGEVGIRHFNGKKEITVEADMVNANASVGEAIKLVTDSVVPKLKARFPGIESTFQGQAERARDTQGPMMVVLGLTVFLVVLILALNFGSAMQAFIVLTAVPAGVFSAFLGHGLEGKPVSLFSFWGIIALVGILVNDAVVMLDTYNRYIKEGMSVAEAAYQAGRSRFRAVLLTSITTVAGLYPLILEDSFQAQFLIPMAIAVAHGLLWGTVFTILFLPSVILFYNDVRRVLFWFKENVPTGFALIYILITFILNMVIVFSGKIAGELPKAFMLAITAFVINVILMLPFLIWKKEVIHRLFAIHFTIALHLVIIILPFFQFYLILPISLFIIFGYIPLLKYIFKYHLGTMPPARSVEPILRKEKIEFQLANDLADETAH